MKMNTSNNSYEVVVESYKNFKPVEFKVKFKDGNQLSGIFDSEEIANLAAQLFEMSGRNQDLWNKLFPATLRMWGIKDIWAEI